MPNTNVSDAGPKIKNVNGSPRGIVVEDRPLIEGLFWSVHHTIVSDADPKIRKC